MDLNWCDKNMYRDEVKQEGANGVTTPPSHTVAASWVTGCAFS
jgi:hypothetical protein